MIGVSDAALRRLIDRIREASARHTGLELRGGGTKRFYGNPAHGAVLDTRELAGIVSYEPTELVVTARAGTALAELEQALSARGQCLPFEPPCFGPGGTVGGMVAAGLSGPARATVGPLRDFVLGVTLVNGSGELLTFGGQVMKNVAGYDVSRLLSGSLGVLGLIGEVSLKVAPSPAAGRTLLLELEEGPAMQLLRRSTAAAVPVTASAWYCGQLTVRLAGGAALATDLPGGSELDPIAAARWWSDVRDHRHEFFQLEDAEMARGMSLWRIAVPEMAKPLRLAGAQFVEWAGALRWYRGAASAAEVRAAAAQAGGHATLFRSADKSAGAFTPLRPVTLSLHQRLKRSFDPHGIFNPGRLYPEL